MAGVDELKENLEAKSDQPSHSRLSGERTRLDMLEEVIATDPEHASKMLEEILAADPENGEKMLEEIIATGNRDALKLLEGIIGEFPHFLRFRIKRKLLYAADSESGSALEVSPLSFDSSDEPPSESSDVPIQSSTPESGGGDGGDPPQRPESGEIERVLIPSKLNQDIVEELRSRNFALDCPPTIDPKSIIKDFRYMQFGPDEMRRRFELQSSDFFRKAEIETGIEWYDLLARHFLYKGGRIPVENIATLTRVRNPDYIEDSRQPEFFDHPDYIFARFEKVGVNQFRPMIGEDGQFVEGNVLEIAPGNGDISIRLKKNTDVQRWRRENQHRFGRGQKPPSLKTMRQILRFFSDDSVDKSSINERIKAVDASPYFVNPLRQKRKIDAVQGDICSPSEDFFDTTGIKPHSIDFFSGVLFLDRVENFITPIDNMRCMARLDGSSRAFFGVLLPFEPVADVQTAHEGVKKIPFWNPDGDIRQQFMKNVEVMEVFEDMGDSPDDPVRAQITYNLIMVLNQLGIVVENIAEQPYEVYSPHCVIEEAGTIRNSPQYEALREQTFDDEEIQKMHEAILRNDPEYPDDKIVGYPQRYKRLLLLGCRVRPKNGKRFKSDHPDSPMTLVPQSE